MTIMAVFTKEPKLSIIISDNKKDKRKNVGIVGDSVLNNINIRGFSKTKKVSVSNHAGATSEYILSAAEETFGC